MAVEMAMANAFHRPATANSSESVFVKDVNPCKAFDMYGYAVGWNCFLKIRLYNPIHVYKCADLLLSGSVTGFPMQPYESHIPFILSFLADYNLYGCNWLEFAESGYKERQGSAKTVHRGREIDISVEHILNRQRVEHEKRHTQVYETQSTKISISSLSEARETDAQWRDKSGIKPWVPQNLQPVHQQLSQNWPWERSGDHRKLLKERIVDNEENGIVHNQDLSLDLFPTASELVPSISLFNKPVDSSNVTSEEWISSQEEITDISPKETSKGKGSQAPVALKVTPSASPHELPTNKRGGHQHQHPPPKLVRPNRTNSELIAILDQLSESESSISQVLSQSGNEKPQTPHAFGLGGNNCLQLSSASPSTLEVVQTNGITEYTPLHFSSSEDVSAQPLKYGEQEYFVKTLDPEDLEPFKLFTDSTFPSLHDYLIEDNDEDEPQSSPKRLRLELTQPAPSTQDVQKWLDSEQIMPISTLSNPSGNSYQFISLESREVLTDELLTCALEIHATTRPGKVPKPSEDPICAVFWHISGPKSEVVNHGVITTYPLHYSADVPSVVVVESEQHVLDEVIQMVRFFNPDILTGYEVNDSSWGYARARYCAIHPEHRDTFFSELGRIKPAQPNGWRNFAAAAASSSGDNDMVIGRHLLNLWNILRKEVTLSKYTLEYVVYHTLHERIPHYSYDDLTAWWLSREPPAVNSVVLYWSQRVELVLKLFAHFEIVNRTCERSRIIGIDFWSSLTRGSQFQVEAVMSRLSRRENYLLLSPSKSQVGQQNALEYIPLVMEPRSEFYTDPVCVLDFRSLYPSIVIALNLCYSTSIGRVDLWRGRNKLGVKQNHELQRGILSNVGEENIYVAPNGIGYVTPKVRKSLLAQMLGEILDTRFMINETRKETGYNANNSRFQRNLNSKQLALKFIANVTYGYTSASFSGRMPCAELADSIVLSGREILQWCIRKIESTTKWGIKPQVVYGDTDSLFVRLPGVSKTQAFRIGKAIASMITTQTPDPITLKLEKVYSPCILLTKKRYVGHSYENENQEVPMFDAKGVETIRRDGTPIVQKIEKRALQILFDTCDLSKVKSYLYNQWRGILSGAEVKVQDFCFAQEVKLGHYKTTNGTSNLPGGAVVSLKKLLKDDGAEPQYRERVPFVITAGPAGSRINDRAVSPEEMMQSSTLVLDGEYYIQKTIIPPLERLFNLLGANIRDWYKKMPRTIRLTPLLPQGLVRGGTLNGFLKSEMCASCLENRRTFPDYPLCADCSTDQPRSRYILTSRAHLQEEKLASAMSTCNMCSKRVPTSNAEHTHRTHPCQSIDCPIYYEREAAHKEHELSLQLLNALI